MGTPALASGAMSAPGLRSVNSIAFAPKDCKMSCTGFSRGKALAVMSAWNPSGCDAPISLSIAAA